MTQTHSLSLTALFTQAWEDLTQNTWFFLGIVAAIIGAQMFAGMLESGDGAFALVGIITGTLINAIVAVGVLRVLLRFVDGNGARFDDIIPPAQHVVWYIVFQIVMVVIVVGMAMMSIVLFFTGILGVSLGGSGTFPYDSLQAGVAAALHINMMLAFIAMVTWFFLTVFAIVYVALRFMFAPYVIVDRNMNAFAALRASSLLTRGVKLRLLALMIVIVFINILGMMAFGIGLIITVPLSLIVMVRTYRTLYARLKESAAAHTSPDASTGAQDDGAAEAPTGAQGEHARDTKETDTESDAESTEENTTEADTHEASHTADDDAHNDTHSTTKAQ